MDEAIAAFVKMVQDSVQKTIEDMPKDLVKQLECHKAGREKRNFHYCSIDTLKTIVQNKQLRFTDVQYLKDTTEFMNAIYLLKQV